MERREAIKISVAAIAAGGVGAVTLTTAFKPDIKPAAAPEKLGWTQRDSQWTYLPLDPAVTAALAYKEYPNGSCMYGTFTSIILQLAERIGEPFSSFPVQMMRYGHGGVNGQGTVCGALNGAAALIGLLVEGKEHQDALVAELFSSYENTPLPVFKPSEPGLDYKPPTSVAKSVLCHASTTRWGEVAGLRIDSKERKERCRRLTADIAAQTATILNRYNENTFFTNAYDNETVRTCMTCHGNEGKLSNTAGKMNCTSCHTKSLGHKLFGDAHYRFMKKR